MWIPINFKFVQFVSIVLICDIVYNECIEKCLLYIEIIKSLILLFMNYVVNKVR